MKNSHAATVIGLLFSSVLPSAAQDACPTPELLLGQPINALELIEQAGGQEAEKGEFETTAQFEARKATIQMPPRVVVPIETKPGSFVYDADKQVFKFYVFNFEAVPLYRHGFQTAQEKELYGTISYGNPVQIKVSEKTLSESEYEASNAFGATATIQKSDEIDYVVFDNKGRETWKTGDDLFTIRDSYVGAQLEIPVPLTDAPAAKSSMKMVALIEPRRPYVGEQDYQSSPKMDHPYDRHTTYKFLFADIKCVGALDGNGTLLAHWKTR